MKNQKTYVCSCGCEFAQPYCKECEEILASGPARNIAAYHDVVSKQYRPSSEPFNPFNFDCDIDDLPAFPPSYGKII